MTERTDFRSDLDTEPHPDEDGDRDQDKKNRDYQRDSAVGQLVGAFIGHAGSTKD